MAVITCDSASQRIYTKQNTLVQTMKVANYICITEYRGPLGICADWYSKSRIEIPTQRSAMIIESLMIVMVFFSSFARTPIR